MSFSDSIGMANRGRCIGFGAVLLIPSVLIVSRDLEHARRSVNATAEVLELTTECEANYKLIGDSIRRYEKMDCEIADSIAKAAGPRKDFHVDHNEFARLEYRLQNSETHQAKALVSDIVHDRKLEVGDKLEVTYNPAKPDEVREHFNLKNAAILGGASFVGLLFVLIGLGVSVAPVFTSVFFLLTWPAVQLVRLVFGSKNTPSVNEAGAVQSSVALVDSRAQTPAATMKSAGRSTRISSISSPVASRPSRHVVSARPTASAAFGRR